VHLVAFEGFHIPVARHFARFQLEAPVQTGESVLTVVAQLVPPRGKKQVDVALKGFVNEVERDVDGAPEPRILRQPLKVRAAHDFPGARFFSGIAVSVVKLVFEGRADEMTLDESRRTARQGRNLESH
jgi:hypothetical protein